MNLITRLLLQPENETTITAHPLRSVDNHNMTERGGSSLTNGIRLGSRRRLPDLPSNYAACDGDIGQSTFNRQRFVKYFTFTKSS